MQGPKPIPVCLVVLAASVSNAVAHSLDELEAQLRDRERYLQVRAGGSRFAAFFENDAAKLGLLRRNADPRKGDIVMRTGLMLLALVVALSGRPAQAEEPRTAVLYKNPQCSCCETYADYLRENGFDVTVEATHDLPLIKRQHGVPAPLEGCHTTLVDGYVVEGHVPVDAIIRLLTEKPTIKGISLPGMPAGSPGMFGEKTEPFTIYEIGDGPPKVYAVE